MKILILFIIASFSYANQCKIYYHQTSVKKLIIGEQSFVVKQGQHKTNKTAYDEEVFDAQNIECCRNEAIFKLGLRDTTEIVKNHYLTHYAYWEYDDSYPFSLFDSNGIVTENSNPEKFQDANNAIDEYGSQIIDSIFDL